MTLAAGEPEQILSQDTRGRVLVTQERRELLLGDYDRSGMSPVKFAQYLGIKYSTLAYWLQRRRLDQELSEPPRRARSGSRSGQAFRQIL
jgi:hypothetical protein